MAATILPFRREPANEPLSYATGVAPFDRSNPAHVRAWNTVWALGMSELRAMERR